MFLPCCTPNLYLSICSKSTWLVPLLPEQVWAEQWWLLRFHWQKPPILHTLQLLELEKKQASVILTMHYLTNSITMIFSKWGQVDNIKPEILVVTVSVASWPNPLEVDARIESWYVTPGWSWEKRWLVALEDRDTVRPDRSRGTEGSKECRPQ